MSDYFSLKIPTGSQRPALTPSMILNEPMRSSTTSPYEDEISYQSSESHFLADMVQDNMTLQDSQFSFMPKQTTHIGDKDYILPRSNRNSPFHTSVPIPKQVKLDTSQYTEEPEGYTEEDIYDNDNLFVKEYPTVLLADRFYKWKKILKALIIYLKQVAYSQEEFARINTQLKDSVKFKFLTNLDEKNNAFVDPLTSRRPVRKAQPVPLAEQKMQPASYQEANGSGIPNESTQHFLSHDLSSPLGASGFMKFGSGSIQDLQIILKKYHISLASQQYKISKEIITTLIPKLENLRKDLSDKVRDIKSLHNNFKTNINEHIKISSQLLNKYIAACKVMSNQKYTQRDKKIKPKHDPFLLKLQLELQLKRQLAEENYLREAFINLQSSGIKLEKIVYSKIQQALQSYSTLIGSEAQLMIKMLSQELHKGICSNPPAIEWDQFVACHSKCLLNWKSNDPVPEARTISEIEYPRNNSPIGKCIKSGYMKFQKEKGTTQTGYFILTANYLHEFKSSNLYRSTHIVPQTVPLISKVSSKKTKNTTKLPALKYQPLQQSKKKKTLLPNFSLLLDNCTVVEVTETKIVLKAPATYSEYHETPETLPHHLSTSSVNIAKPAAENLSHLSSKKVNEAQKIVSKSSHGFSKFLRGTSSSNNLRSEPTRVSSTGSFSSKDLSNPVSSTQLQDMDPVLWTFSLETANPTALDLKYFKKWTNDIKYLTSFSNVIDRSKFVEENMMKSRTSTTNLGISNCDGSRLMLSNFTQSSLSIPDAPSSASMMAYHRSRISSPILDDKGNLITPLKQTAATPTGNYTGPVRTINSQTKMENGTNLQTIPSVSSPNISLRSPRTENSEGSSGGYFALPLSKQDSSPNSYIPYYSDNTDKLHTTTSNNSNFSMNLNSSNMLPTFRSMTISSTNESLKIPQVKLNSQETIVGQPPFRRSTSASSVPTTSGESTMNATTFYNNTNHSGNTLNTAQLTAPRIQTVRKHKKNVSFGSLSSLKFSKRSSGTPGYYINEQMMHDGIQEDEDTSSLSTGKAIKLNQSIYS